MLKSNIERSFRNKRLTLGLFLKVFAVFEFVKFDGSDESEHSNDLENPSCPGSDFGDSGGPGESDCSDGRSVFGVTSEDGGVYHFYIKQQTQSTDEVQEKVKSVIKTGKTGDNCLKFD